MKLLCRVFGHKPAPWFHLSCHPNIGNPYYDGIRRAHRDLKVRCARCDTQYLFGKVIDPLLSGKVGMNLFHDIREERT